MEAFSSFFESQSSSRNGWSYDSLKNFRQISPTVQTHLKQVYLSLCCALVASAVGAYLHILWNVGGLLTTLGCMASIVWLLSTPSYEEQKRVSLLMAAGLFEGASIGPLIELAIDFDPSIVVSAFVGTALAFGCFSAAAMLAKRREYLYLGGLLSSGLSILFWLHFASSIFGGSVAMFKFELYFGLLVFVGYMVVDTQDIIEKAHLGDLDCVKHALTLFTDFIAIFVRILIIMLKNASSEKEEAKWKYYYSISFMHPVRELQERCQQQAEGLEYKATRSGNLATVEVYIDGIQVGTAQNQQKKMAQKLAARNALVALKEKETAEANKEKRDEDEKKNSGTQTFTRQTLNDICLRRNWPMPLYRCVNEGGPAHAKRFTFAVRVNTSDRGWTDECVGEPMPSVKKAKDSAAVLLLELLNNWYA